MGSQETIKNNLRASMRKRNELLACEFSAYESEVKAINESQPELSVELTTKTLLESCLRMRLEVLI